MVDEPSNEGPVPLPTIGPWMPPPGNKPPWEVMDRDLSHRLGKLASGLPGEFEYPLTKFRLNLFLDQWAGSIGRPPQSPTFEYIDRLEDVLKCLELRTNTRDLSDLSLLTIRIDIRLFSSAWAMIGQMRIADPDDTSNSAFRGIHSIDGLRLEQSGLVFRHNWDGWTNDWILSLDYLGDHFVRAIAYGATRDFCADDFEIPDAECDSVFKPLLARPAPRTPDAGGERVSALRSHSRFTHREVWQHCLYLEQVPDLFGWAFVDLGGRPDGIPELYELFIHPLFRKMGLVRALLGVTCFDVYAMGFREMNLTCREADVKAWQLGINSWPNWLARLPWASANLPEDAKTVRVRILDFMLSVVTSAQLTVARSRGVLLPTDFLLEPADESNQIGIVL